MGEFLAHGLHPGTRILGYVLCALAMPGLDDSALLWLSLALVPAGLGRLAQIGRLLRRVRWLALLLVLGYAYSLPGAPLALWLGAFSPTYEGIDAGLMQAWRLALLLILLDLWVLRLPTERLMTGIHGLLRPFGRFGLDAARATLRLALTLEAMQRPVGLRGLQALLSGHTPDMGLPQCYTLTLEPYGRRDVWLMGGMLAGLAWLYA
ncbi:MAG: hypothetical protein RMK60_03480 [Burkholderiales bacterium]|nr:hypothetical protein [Burkholderiales bacterium]